MWILLPSSIGVLWPFNFHLRKSSNKKLFQCMDFCRAAFRHFTIADFTVAPMASASAVWGVPYELTIRYMQKFSVDVGCCARLRLRDDDVEEKERQFPHRLHVCFVSCCILSQEVPISPFFFVSIDLTCSKVNSLHKEKTDLLFYWKPLRHCVL